MKRGKAAGLDGLPIEGFLGSRGTKVENPSQLLRSPLDELMVDLFNRILQSGGYPDAWRLAALVPLPKGGGLNMCMPSNYRGIALLSCMAKLFANVLEARLSAFQWSCRLVCDEQFGFTNGRRTLDAAFVLDTLIDEAVADGCELYVAFVDFQKAYDFVPRDALFFKMLHSHMGGSVFRILHSMYSAVQSVVRYGHHSSNVISQFVGLRQGCILSPCLFSLFIADFPAFLAAREGDQRCEGVHMHDVMIRVLMYADDLALVARSAVDLQRMLDALREYASMWHLTVNLSKTKVVIFAGRRTGNSMTHQYQQQRAGLRAASFTFNGLPVIITDEYKYLGVLFHEDVWSTYNKCQPCNVRLRIYNEAIKHRVYEGRGKLAKWIRQCKCWLFDPKMVISLFKTWVLPAFEYGVGLWGAEVARSKSTSSSWSDIDSFWMSIARHALRAPSRAPLAALQGELGWWPFSLRACWQTAALWSRLTAMDDSCLARKAMHVQMRLVSNRQPCWLTNFKSLMYQINSKCSNMYDEWFRSGFNDRTCFTMRFDDRQHKVVRVGLDVVIQEQMHVKLEGEWLNELARIEARRGLGGNKLRTYAMFKKDCEYEPYLNVIRDERKRALFTKFRIGVAPLRIETGRYEMSEGKKGIHEYARICQCCGIGVESEFHFLLVCPVYTQLRNQLLNVYEKQVQSIQHLTMQQIFVHIMGCTDSEIVKAVSEYLWRAFELRESELRGRRVLGV